MYLIELNTGEGRKLETRADAWEHYKKLTAQFSHTEPEVSRKATDFLRKGTKEEVKDHPLTAKHLSLTKEKRRSKPKNTNQNKD